LRFGGKHSNKKIVSQRASLGVSQQRNKYKSFPFLVQQAVNILGAKQIYKDFESQKLRERWFQQALTSTRKETNTQKDRKRRIRKLKVLLNK
jgi:hypothetical protein